MKIAYHADDAIDAQLISDILNGNGIFAQVRGAHMQGAVGEAAAMGNVKVWVNDQELDEAKAVIKEWSSATYVDDEAEELFQSDGVEGASDNRSAQFSIYTLVLAACLTIMLLMVLGL